ncbi:hypothetical protein GCM10017778_11960 [Streptomyces vinaceus]|nr:hypothetical protein GCM10017778_11960 [Streptomyces vinaceus]
MYGLRGGSGPIGLRSHRVYENTTRGIAALVFRCQPPGGTEHTSEESTAVAWLTPEEVSAQMSEVHVIRLLDALDEAGPHVRSHGGRTWSKRADQADHIATHRGLRSCHGGPLSEIDSVEEFIRLRRSEDPAERDRSARAAMPLTVWRQLVRKHSEMRFWAAHNRTCPPEIMTELSKDADWRVRQRVLGKRSCPPEIMRQLADDPHDAVRNTVATHPRSPRSAVARLVDDPWPVVAEAARARLANWTTQ